LQFFIDIIDCPVPVENISPPFYNDLEFFTLIFSNDMLALLLKYNIDPFKAILSIKVEFFIE